MSKLLTTEQLAKYGGDEGRWRRLIERYARERTDVAVQLYNDEQARFVTASLLREADREVLVYAVNFEEEASRVYNSEQVLEAVREAVTRGVHVRLATYAKVNESHPFVAAALTVS